MLVFIIPLKSSKLSKSWELTCKIFERTLKSVCNQTSSKFRVIVVCHEKPDIEFIHPHVTYVEVEFPKPERSDDVETLDKDKYRKLLAGLFYSRKINLSHIMFVDADDCVSKHLAEFVSQHLEHNGWYTDKGYQYNEQSKILKIRNRNFHLRTGTSHIVKFDLLKPDMELDICNIKWGCIFGHADTKTILQKRGFSLDPLPFIGAIHIIDNGENIWWSQDKLIGWTKKHGFKEIVRAYIGKIVQFFLTRSLTDSIHDEFGIYDINIS